MRASLAQKRRSKGGDGVAPYTIIAKAALTPEDLSDIRELAALCNQHDGIDLKLNEDMLEHRPGNCTDDFLCYADGRLIGYLGLYCFHAGEAEVSGMVHPAYRRQGVFRQLQERAEEECRDRGIPQLLFIVQRESQSGKAFMEAIGASYRFSEYWMELGDVPQQTSVPSVEVKPAGREDRDTLVRLNVLGFHMDEEHAREMTAKIELASDRETYLVMRGGEAVGKISVVKQAEQAVVFGFCIHPDHRGRGYGRQALARTIRTLRDQGYGRVALEVACENTRALILYESCGFAVKSANDYYQLPIT